MAPNESLPAWREEAIAKNHDRKTFDCGVSELNDYLRRYARQNHEVGGSKTFVAVPKDAPETILGYYSISPGGLTYERVPEILTRRLGRYDVPVFRLGRLAVDRRFQGKGLGARLLLNAGERALAVAAVAGGVALAIDAKDERAAQWYGSFGALALLDDPMRLILPLETIAIAVEAAKGTRRAGRAGRRSRNDPP